MHKTNCNISNVFLDLLKKNTTIPAYIDIESRPYSGMIMTFVTFT